MFSTERMHGVFNQNHGLIAAFMLEHEAFSYMKNECASLAAPYVAEIFLEYKKIGG